MNGQDALNWVCQNGSWLGPALAVILPASVISGWADKMPPWLAHIVNGLGLNWGDILRAAVLKMETVGNGSAAPVVDPPVVDPPVVAPPVAPPPPVAPAAPVPPPPHP